MIKSEINDNVLHLHDNIIHDAIKHEKQHNHYDYLEVFKPRLNLSEQIQSLRQEPTVPKSNRKLLNQMHRIGELHHKVISHALKHNPEQEMKTGAGNPDVKYKRQKTVIGGGNVDYVN